MTDTEIKTAAAATAQKAAEVKAGQPGQAGTPANDNKSAESAELNATSKANFAFIKLRQERSALKKENAELKARGTTGQAASAADGKDVEAEISRRVAQEVEKETHKLSIAGKEEKALSDLASDAEISALPSGVMDVIDLVDSDSRLSRLYAVDPEVAISEARKLYKARKGITSTTVPVDRTPTAKLTVADAKDKQAILAKMSKLQPTSKAWKELYKQLKS